MLEFIQEYVEQNELFTPNDPILLAVSGGVDSMVMAELFHRAGYNFSIAHCNFGLRGTESNQDEAFVANCAQSYGVKFYVKHFKTESMQDLIKSQSKWPLALCVMNGLKI